MAKWIFRLTNIFLCHTITHKRRWKGIVRGFGHSQRENPRVRDFYGQQRNRPRSFMRGVWRKPALTVKWESRSLRKSCAFMAYCQRLHCTHGVLFVLANKGGTAEVRNSWAAVYSVSVNSNIDAFRSLCSTGFSESEGNRKAFYLTGNSCFRLSHIVIEGRFWYGKG